LLAWQVDLSDITMRGYSLTESFLAAACKLQKEQTRKLCKALLLFYENPSHPGLNFEKLVGGDGTLRSIRVDDNYRAILQTGSGATVFHFVGTHEEAYRFAERVTPAIRARLAGPRPA
jgi:hypothetical protein